MSISSERSSRVSASIYVCDCRKKAKMYTSWSLKNSGRRSYTCCQPQDSRCDYFEWFDVETEGRHGDVITQLNNRRIYLEEKIALLEEKVSMLEGELTTKKKKAKALEETNAKYVWIYWIAKYVGSKMTYSDGSLLGVDVLHRNNFNQSKRARG